MLLCGLIVGPRAPAHEFWVQPSGYWTAPAIPIAVTLQVGDHKSRQRSLMPRGRIIRFEATGPDSTLLDLSDQLRLGGVAHDALLRFDSPGTYILVLESDNRARSDLAADAFNEYIQAEGLTPALEYRSRTGRMSAPGSERYSRRTKTLVQVGPADAQRSSHVTQPIGLSLEIVPELSPYAEPHSGRLPVRVVYENRALGGALVKLIDLKQGGRMFERRLTDATGRADFTWPTRGTWLLSVVWTKPLTGANEVEFETTFSTLSFGFAGDPAPPTQSAP